jgi:hypothetical protein
MVSDLLVAYDDDGIVTVVVEAIKKPLTPDCKRPRSLSKPLYFLT